MNENEFTDIHLRWNNGQDLNITVLLHKDNIGVIKQLVMSIHNRNYTLASYIKKK